MVKESLINRDIQNILAVLGTAIVCACLLALVFIYYYGPTGNYLAGHTILDPAIIDQINYQEKNLRTGQKVHFIFDNAAFTYFDSQKGQMHKKIIPLENYQKFYTLVASEKSLLEVSDKIKDLFLKSHPTILTINMRTMEGSPHTTTKIFQIIQFVQEDYFRVRLHDSQDQEEWAYFYRLNLFKEIMHLFTQPANL